MIEKVTHINGVVTYQSPRLRALGVRHGFTTRVGGMSKPPYDTLNLGVLSKGPQTDANTSVSENFRRVRAALGLERLVRVEAHQVHQATVWDAPPQPVRWCDAPCADAIVTDLPGKLLCIRTADCVPILLASPDGGQVAAVHAGWRGLVAGVIEAAVGRFPQPPIAAIGPCISVEHFEVGPEVARQFDPSCVDSSRATPHVDLQLAAAMRLRASGVELIDVNRCCTYRDAELFFSHRRDVTHMGKPTTGRMAALITPGSCVGRT